MEKQAENRWKLLYCLLSDMKRFMDVTYNENDCEVTNDDVDYFIAYFNNTVKNINTTLGYGRK